MQNVKKYINIRNKKRQKENTKYGKHEMAATWLLQQANLHTIFISLNKLNITSSKFPSWSRNKFFFCLRTGFEVPYYTDLILFQWLNLVLIPTESSVSFSVPRTNIKLPSDHSILETFINFSWLSPVFSSLFSWNNTRFYARNNPVQTAASQLRIYFISPCTWKTLKLQFSKMADAK